MPTEGPTRVLRSARLGRRARGRTTFIAASYVMGALGTTLAVAQTVDGRVELTSKAEPSRARRGYVSFMATEASSVVPAPHQPAIFLAVKDTLPLDPAPPQRMSLVGLALEPAVVACAHEGKLILSNDDVEPVSFLIEDERVGPIAPGESIEHTCAIGEQEGLRRIRVAEWPHVLGGVYVGGNGVPGLPDANGRFTMKAAKGTYELRLIGLSGVLLTREVEVVSSRNSVGTLTVEGIR